MTTALLEKQKMDKSVVDAGAGPIPYHWKVESYYKAYEADVFGDNTRIELIHGRITVKTPPNPRHSYLADTVYYGGP